MSLRNGILGILSYGPRTGYSLKKEFDQSIGYLWTASLSQIYRELGALEKEGLIRSSIEAQEERPDKKVYTITPGGKSAFLQWLEEFPENLSSVKRDEFMLRVFFGANLDNKALIGQFERFIKQKEQYIKQLNLLVAKLDEKTENPRERDYLFWRLTIKRALMTLESNIVWAKECIAQIIETD